MPINALTEIVNLFAPDADMRAAEHQVIITCPKSLYRLGTVLEGAIEMYNAIYQTERLIWRTKSKYSIVLEHIVLK